MGVLGFIPGITTHYGAMEFVSHTSGAGQLRYQVLWCDHLSTANIIQRLPTLSRAELTTLDSYERKHASRPHILNAIERLRGNEPWPGYDAMIPDQITARLQTAAPAAARQVLDHERRHRRRGTLVAIAKARSIEASPGPRPGDRGLRHPTSVAGRVPWRCKLRRG
ncbi:hypothetical protein GCM10018980_18850 [Streptomyces capoamus]|uniref:Uncharacterized protein n=1 Tax=Streptomyces capoamus TaxID=68183 RepID=A0A919C1U0_9ACTN|nr:hypothetical protein GCM10010501_32450 [Streptomyces libani subsp. rufus]GHG42715.1 hypothetical protein GCM10018980_18850 [Streptomyces capoamus]